MWQDAAVAGFTRRRIIDVRLARMLLAHGMVDFTKVTERDFQGLGLRRRHSEVVWRQDTETFIRCVENAFRHFG